MANPSGPPPPPPPPIQRTTSTAAALVMEGEGGGGVLDSASHLSRRELLARRSRRLKQLGKIYRSHYWALMEQLKSKYREYYWLYGKSPFKFNSHSSTPAADTTTITDNNSNNKKKKMLASLSVLVKKEEEEEAAAAEEEADEGVRKCRVGGCKSKAMPLTPFCHSHILSDPNQTLYQSCSFLLKCAQGKPVLCGKPTLRSTVPPLCPPHFQKAESYLARALRKEGLPIPSSSSSIKVSPKFHLVVAEFVRQIQCKRRASALLQPNHTHR